MENEHLIEILKQNKNAKNSDTEFTKCVLKFKKRFNILNGVALSLVSTFIQQK